MLSLLDGLLSKLPFNGWKTALGYALTVAPVVAPQLVAPVQGVVHATGALVLSLGVLHKVVKDLLAK